MKKLEKSVKMLLHLKVVELLLFLGIFQDKIAARSAFLTNLSIFFFFMAKKTSITFTAVTTRVQNQLQSAAGLHMQYEWALEGFTDVEINSCDLKGGNEPSMLFFSPLISCFDHATIAWV